MAKNRIYIIIGIILAAVAIVAGITFFFISTNSSKQASIVPTPEEEPILTLTPDQIGLSMSLIASGKFANNGVLLKISNISDISSIDYQMEYTAKGDIPRGAIGHVDIKPTDSTFSQELPFGTCSDKCHFDEGVKDVKVTLKIVKKDGKAYSVEAPFNF